MKKCPKCKAEIQENARFCLYCMTSFEEKQTIEEEKPKIKWWPYALAAVLLAALVLGVVLLASKGASPSDSKNGATSSAIRGESAILDESGVASSKEENLKEESKSGEKNTSSSKAQQGNDSQKEESGGESQRGQSSATKNTSSTQSTPEKDNKTSSSAVTSSAASSAYSSSTVTSSATSSASSSSTTTSSATSSASSSSTVTSSATSSASSSSAATSSATSGVEYIYRQAQYGDDFSVGANLENCVVITGVKKASANGKYTIPETINGKKVVAIMGLAFCGEGISNTVKTVVVPASVKTIWNYAFSTCYNLTDIYFCGSAIYTEWDAFADASKRNADLTIHCSANCSDRNYRYYKNSASNYDAEYKEWNG